MSRLAVFGAPGLTVIGGSPTSAADVERCVQGSDAAIHCLGIGGDVEPGGLCCRHGARVR